MSTDSTEFPSLGYELLTLIKGFRNGIVYGAKIRFPHALVMTFLFREGGIVEKLKLVMETARQHAWNLGRFVFIYKGALLILRCALDDEKRERLWHPLLAGAIGGFLIFRHNNTVNNQIVMYLLSRILVGLVKHFYQKWKFGMADLECLMTKSNSLDTITGSNGLLRLVGTWMEENGFAVQATVVWAIVMWLFRYHQHVLQPSLQSSMQYLYNDSNHWNSFRNFIVFNK